MSNTALLIEDASAIEALQVMRRRHGGDRLLVYREDGRWRDLTSTAVNGYLAELFGGGFTAKDFRTWHATVLCATSLADAAAEGVSATARKRAVRAAIAEVASYLGNTVAVARSSYVDPRIVDRYQAGETIALALASEYPSPDERRSALERAVIELLGQ